MRSPVNTSPASSRIPAHLGASVVRYTFTVRDLHSLLLAGLPGAPEIMATSDGEPNPPISRPGLLSADRLVSLGLAVALVGTQMTWMAFLGWVLLSSTIREKWRSQRSKAPTSWERLSD